MIRPEPEIVLHLFLSERNALLELLSSLTPDEWAAPTVCGGWSVKDVSYHLLGNDISILKNRDEPAHNNEMAWKDLVVFINRQNFLWVEAGRRISTPVLIDFLRLTGEQTTEYFNTRDLSSMGRAVSWAGTEPAPVWLDLAREYTERWVHQQHIRDAVNTPGMKEPAFLSPVLNIFTRALPQTFKDVQAAEGTSIQLDISGSAGGQWFVVKSEKKWELFKSIPSSPDSTITLDQDTAWRLFTKGISKEQGLARCDVFGDSDLGLKVLDTVSIIA